MPSAIVTNFVGTQWPVWSGAKRPHVHLYGQPKTLTPASKPAAKAEAKPEKPGLLSKLMGSGGSKETKVETVMDGPFKKPVASPVTSPGGTKGGSRDAELAQLSEMGFTIEVNHLVHKFIPFT